MVPMLKAYAFAQRALGIFTVLSKAISSQRDIRVPEDNLGWKDPLRIIGFQSLLRAGPA